jgi:hypothetical protein
MQRSSYREGDWFAVPLREGGYALGVIARVNPDGVLLGYFFGPRRAEMPTLEDVRGFNRRDAVVVGKFGHLGLTQRKWPVLGQVDGWDRSEWPVPVFVRYEELTGRALLAYYDDEDPNKLLREEELPPGAVADGPKDSMMGAGFVEAILTRALP